MGRRRLALLLLRDAVLKTAVAFSALAVVAVSLAVVGRIADLLAHPVYKFLAVVAAVVGASALSVALVEVALRHT
jgi:hypothetical protein